MPYNKNLELPEFKQEQDGKCTYTHNHAKHYIYKCDKWTLKRRKNLRNIIEEDKGEINRCIFFMQNCLKDKSLTGVQQAILKQLIKNDEVLIESLSTAKPESEN